MLRIGVKCNLTEHTVIQKGYIYNVQFNQTKKDLHRKSLEVLELYMLRKDHGHENTGYNTCYSAGEG